MIIAISNAGLYCQAVTLVLVPAILMSFVPTKHAKHENVNAFSVGYW